MHPWKIMLFLLCDMSFQGAVSFPVTLPSAFNYMARIPVVSTGKLKAAIAIHALARAWFFFLFCRSLRCPYFANFLEIL